MLAGLIGPAFWPIENTAPDNYDGGLDGMEDAPRDDGEDATARPDAGEVDDWDTSSVRLNVLSRAYRQAYGGTKLEDAVLEMFCMAAKLNGLLFGDNMKDAIVTRETDIEAMSKLAQELCSSKQVLLGPVDTTKLHRLMFHISQELRNRGNLWEGDTSENESLHGCVKAMFKRTNKHGLTLLLQMLRSEETQSEVLQTLEREERRAERDASIGAAGLGGPVPDEEGDEALRLRLFRRGVRVTLGSVAARPGLALLALALGVEL